MPKQNWVDSGKYERLLFIYFFFSLTKMEITYILRETGYKYKSVFKSQMNTILIPDTNKGLRLVKYIGGGGGGGEKETGYKYKSVLMS